MLPGQWWIAALGALPALAAMVLVDYWDRKRPEPRWTLRWIVFCGALATVPVLLLERFLVLDLGAWAQWLPAVKEGRLSDVDAWTGWARVYRWYLGIALPEELAKLLCVLLFVVRRPEFDERMDGIVYAAHAGLGYALVENILYFLRAEDVHNLVAVYFLRAFLVVPGHAAWAGIMGYMLARRRFDREGLGAWGGLLLAVLLHGSYDFSVAAAGRTHSGDVATFGYLFLSVLVIFVSVQWLRTWTQKALELDDAAELLAHQGIGTPEQKAKVSDNKDGALDAKGS